MIIKHAYHSKLFVPIPMDFLLFGKIIKEESERQFLIETWSPMLERWNKDIESAIRIFKVVEIEVDTHFNALKINGTY